MACNAEPVASSAGALNTGDVRHLVVQEGNVCLILLNQREQMLKGCYYYYYLFNLPVCLYFFFFSFNSKNCKMYNLNNLTYLLLLLLDLGLKHSSTRAQCRSNSKFALLKCDYLRSSRRTFSVHAILFERWRSGLNEPRLLNFFFKPSIWDRPQRSRSLWRRASLLF